MKRAIFFWPAIFILLFPRPSYAHAFGQLYNLPVPFWLYLYGGAGAIAASFIIIAYFINKTTPTLKYPTYNLSEFGFAKIPTKKSFFIVLKIISIILFTLTILTGYLGTNDPRLNFNMTLFWIIFMLLFAYITALIGNVWSIINPWKTTIEWLEQFVKIQIKERITYPNALSYYPALILYFIFILIELVGEITPFKLSLYLTIYTLLTFIGVFLFGKNSWFKYCDFFSVFFKIISKIAPIEFNQGKIYLRPPFIGLLKEDADHFSLLLFVVFMLSSTAYDGFKSTVIGAGILTNTLGRVTSVILGETYLSAQVTKSLGLIISFLMFLYVYLFLMTIAKTVTKSHFPFGKLVAKFTFSLVPIAFAYNLAHYYTLILTEGQNMIREISDPFNFGWNLFHTASYQTNYLVVNANIAWHLQVAFIITGHIIGVYLAHLVALRFFTSHKKAMLSQIPMLALMIIYTLTGLWILALPILSG
jgi:hypothetical protein